MTKPRMQGFRSVPLGDSVERYEWQTDLALANVRVELYVQDGNTLLGGQVFSINNLDDKSAQSVKAWCANKKGLDALVGASLDDEEFESIQSSNNSIAKRMNEIKYPKEKGHETNPNN